MAIPLVGPMSGGAGGIAPDFSSSATQTGDTTSGNNSVGAFPFGAPASQNMLLYVGLGVLAFALLRKTKR